MTTGTARNLVGGGIALLAALGSARPLYPQIGVGTWVRKAAPSMPTMTMEVEACCGGGRRLTYHVDVNGTVTIMKIDSKFDGSEAPVLINGKPSGETMSIKKVDDHHITTTMTMSGKPFGTSKATLSADGKTLTVLNDYSTSMGGGPVGKSTEIWVKK